MASSYLVVAVSPDNTARLCRFDIDKEVWESLPMQHSHTSLEFSCPSAGVLCFTQDSSIHLYQTKTQQCLELANAPKFWMIWDCSFSEDGHSFKLVVYDFEKVVSAYDSRTGRWERKEKLSHDMLDYLAIAVSGKSNKVYLLSACCELGIYDLETFECSWLMLKIPQGSVSDLSLNLDLSLMECGDNLYMVSYMEDDRLDIWGEFNAIGIWKLDKEAEEWVLVSSVAHPGGPEPKEDGEDVAGYTFFCCSNGVDRIWIVIENCEFMWMYRLESQEWVKLPGYPRHPGTLDKAVFSFLNKNK